MNKNLELRLSGSGGQGLILGSIILAQAALNDKNYAVQSQSYGPEARGGMCKAEVIIGKEKIDFAKVEKPDILLALSQSALDKYCKEADTIIADSSLNIPSTCSNKAIRLPILETAEDVLHSPISANIIAISALNTVTHIVDNDSLEKAVLKYVPKGAKELNHNALVQGRQIASAALAM